MMRLVVQRIQPGGATMVGQQASGVGPQISYLATTEELHAARARARERTTVSETHTAWLVARSSALLVASHQRLAAGRARVESMPSRCQAPAPARLPRDSGEH